MEDLVKTTQSMKKDKQSTMIFKSYMLRLPSTFIWNNTSIMRIHFFGLEITLIDKSEDVNLENVVKKNIP